VCVVVYLNVFALYLSVCVYGVCICVCTWRVCVCVCLYIYMNIYTHAYHTDLTMHAHTHAHTYTYTNTHTHIHIHTYKHVHTYFDLYQASNVSWSISKSCRNLFADAWRILSTNIFVSSHNSGCDTGTVPIWYHPLAFLPDIADTDLLLATSPLAPKSFYS